LLKPATDVENGETAEEMSKELLNTSKLFLNNLPKKIAKYRLPSSVEISWSSKDSGCFIVLEEPAKMSPSLLIYHTRAILTLISGLHMSAKESASILEAWTSNQVQIILSSCWNASHVFG
jgi:hypothetical protein